MTIVSEPAVDQQAISHDETPWKQLPISDLNTTITVPENIKYNPTGPRPDQVIFLTATDGQGNNGGIKDIVHLAEENRKAYCNHHGYIYHFINISKYDLGDSHAVWKKIPAIVEAFNTYPDAQWVFWLDLDAIIMTPSQDLNSLLLSKEGMQTALAAGDRHHSSEWAPLNTFQQAVTDFENTDVLIAQDHNGLNAGSFLIRRSKYTQWLLDMWADPFFMHMTWPGKEQDTLVRNAYVILKSITNGFKVHFIRHHKTFREHLGIVKQRTINSFPEGADFMRWEEGDLLVHLAGCWVEDVCQERWDQFWAMRKTF